MAWRRAAQDAFWAIGVFSALGMACEQPPPPIDAVGGVEQLSEEQGFTLHIPPFEVPAGMEVQDCYFFAVPDINDGEDVWIERFKIGQRSGSHHMNVFRVNTIHDLDGRPGDVVRGGECRISTNWADWPLVVNSQEGTVDSPVVDWQLPTGVAQRFRPGEVLMVQSHYVNADLQKTPGGGEVRINFYKAKDEAPIEMGTLFATQQSIRICENGPEVQVYDGACSFPPGQQIHIAAANGHFHGRGTRVEMYTWDGLTLDAPPESDRFYVSEDWNEPPMSLNLDAVVPSGGGVWWSCSYQWRKPAAGCEFINQRDPHQQGDCCYTFGNSAESAEHCNVFLYYWPKVDTSVFCS